MLTLSGQRAAFTASVRYIGTTTGWLTVNPPSGAAPADLTITANPTSVAPGTYLGQVAITGGSGGAVVNVFFTVEAVSGRGTFIATPSSLTFIGQAGQPLLSPQTLTIASPSGPGAAFDAFASSAGNWLSVLPGFGVAPATLTVGATQAGLPSGTYTGTITITPRPSGNPTIIPVTLVATGTNIRTTKLAVSQPSLAINHQTGTAEPPLQSIDVTTTGEVLEYTASTTTSWLRLVTPINPVPSNSVTGMTPNVFSVQINPAGLAQGPHLGTITVNVPGLGSQLVPVNLTITSSPALNAHPSSIAFEHAIGTEPPLEREVTITSTGSTNVSFTTSVSAPWLRVTPASENTSSGFAIISVSVQPGGLTVGTFNGSVTLTPQTPQGAQGVTIPITLTVTGSSEVGEIEVSASTVELTGIVGGPGPSRTVLVTASELSTVQHGFTAAASSAEGWLSVSPFSGTTPATLTITANAARLSRPGTYQGFVVVTSLLNGSQRTIIVSYTIAERAIAAAPSSLSFVQEQKGVNPSPQTVDITTNAPSNFTVSEVPAWLRVSPTSGTAPATLTVWVDMSVVPPGTSGGTIVVTGRDNRLSIPVAVMLLPAPAPKATPESISFTYQVGNPAPAARPITVESTTSELADFSASAATESGGNWLVVAPTSGVTPATLRATINIAQLIPGRYTGAITLASADGVTVQTIPVTLTVNGPTVVVQRVLHAATLAPTPVAPGQLVTITGTGLGPAGGVAARPTAAGAYETRLANTRVLFDDVAAPLLFVGPDQINAIVPYAVYGRLSARVQVESASSLSVPIEVRVVDSAPGLFTASGLGRGQASALNADLTANSATNAATRGSIITVFGTGEGHTDPQGQDGRIIITDLRRPLLPVTARVGGLPAEVTYAGSGALMVSGMFQVNLRVPEGVEPGNVPVEIQVGNATSQSGVTIVVR